MVNILIVASLIIICSFYMQYTYVYYSYCEYSQRTGKYLNLKLEESVEIYTELCKDMYRDYSKHTLLKRIINIFYEFLKTDKVDIKDLERIIKEIDYDKLKNLMKILKIIHLLLYGVATYVLLVKFPIYFIKLTKFVLKKILLILFIILLMDAGSKILFNIDIDILQILNPDFYLNSRIYLSLSYIISNVRIFLFRFW